MEIMCRYSSCYSDRARLRWHGGRRGCSRAAVGAVWAAPAAPQRAAAAPAAGSRGPAAGSWGRARRRPGGQGQRDHHPQGPAGAGRGPGPLPLGRARRPGGGRKRAEDNDPGLVPALLGLVEPDERGDPMSPLRWTTKSLRHLATELARQGHAVSASTVGRLLREQGFSLQGTAKALEGAQHPTGMGSSATSMSRSRRSRPTGSRSSASMPRRRRCWGSCPTPAGSGAPGRPDPRRGSQLLHRSPRRAGHPVWRLRPHPRRRLGQRRRRSRHRHVRGRIHPPLVAGARPARLPRRDPAADHRGRGRLQQLPLPGLEGGAGPAGRRGGPDHHGLPFPAGHLQVEQDRAPAVFADHDELARPAVDQP